jgi:ABC-type enterochelin transport system substrate-binding protein
MFLDLIKVAIITAVAVDTLDAIGVEQVAALGKPSLCFM